MSPSSKSTVTVQIESVVDEEWIDFVVGYADVFGRNYCGYWALGVQRDRELGWLVYEQENGEVPSDKKCDAVTKAWKEGKPIPKGWHRLNRDACVKAWAEGVKRWGEKWYDNGDADSYDYAIQMALLGEHRYA